MVAGGRLGVVVVVVVDSKCDDGGENRSAEGNKVLKYGLVHGRQWVWAMVGSWEWLGWCWQWLQEAWTLKMDKTKLILF